MRKEQAGSREQKVKRFEFLTFRKCPWFGQQHFGLSCGVATRRNFFRHGMKFPIAMWHLSYFFVKVESVILSLYHRAAIRIDSAMPRGGAVADGASKADREDRNEEIG